ncbi:serine carboxypeptidase S28-domain-containing protein [Chytriomyces sp. MP71]|nr:serine carboxypeptidase S28-domain-containing protein [Chytriomyces sp. MP71]
MTHFSGSPACMSGWTRAVRLFDKAIQSVSTDSSRLRNFLSGFWLSALADTNLGDVGMLVTTNFAATVQYGPSSNYLIQPNQTAGINGITYLDALCDGHFQPAITNPHASDQELLHALQNFTVTYLEQQGASGDEDPGIQWLATTAIKRRDFSNPWFLWYFQACNEFGYGMTAQSLTAPNQLIEGWSVWSQLESLEYYEWYCRTMTLSINSMGIADVEGTNGNYGGLNITTPRILWVNGDMDPWRWLSNYDVAPDPSTQTILLYKNATHCNDLYGRQTSNSEYQQGFFDEVFAVYDEWMAMKIVTSSPMQRVPPNRTAKGTRTTLTTAIATGEVAIATSSSEGVTLDGGSGKLDTGLIVACVVSVIAVLAFVVFMYHGTKIYNKRRMTGNPADSLKKV